MRADVQHFYDARTGTLSYVVSDPESSVAAVIDPLLGFSLSAGRTDLESANAIINYLKARNLSLDWILETHAHADHLSSAQVLKSRVGGSVAIGEGIKYVQKHFGKIFNLGASFVADGRQFDRLFADGDTFRIGNLECRVMHTPGHTNDSVTYLIGAAAFVGDSLFMPDFGTARCDFPGGDAALLYDSIQSLVALPDDTMLFVGHDYPPAERELRFGVTVREQRESNIHVGSNTSKTDFVRMREERDRTLSLPKLILPAIQVNIQAGRLPDVDDNQISYIKIPIDTM